MPMPKGEWYTCIRNWDPVVWSKLLTKSNRLKSLKTMVKKCNQQHQALENPELGEQEHEKNF